MQSITTKGCDKKLNRLWIHLKGFLKTRKAKNKLLKYQKTLLTLNYIKMTIAQIKKASLEHKYLGLRFNSGHLIGVNSKCVEKAINRTKKHLNSKTEFQSYKPLSLNEYINCKHPFI